MDNKATFRIDTPFLDQVNHVIFTLIIHARDEKNALVSVKFEKFKNSFESLFEEYIVSTEEQAFQNENMDSFLLNLIIKNKDKLLCSTLGKKTFDYINTYIRTQTF